MARIEIEWLTDTSECDDCGFMAADGANVRLDGDLVIELAPAAHCFGGTTYDRDDVYRRVLEHFGRWTSITDGGELLAEITRLGHEVTEV